MTTQSPSLLPSKKPKLNWQPKDYQERAIRLLLSQGSVALFLDPGLGKTSICLAAFKILKAKGLAKTMLIIAPLRPMYKVWPDEIKKWIDFEDLTYAILHADVKEYNLDCDADIYIINPEGLLWLLDGKRSLPIFDVLCVDESTRFKASQTRRFKLLKPYLPRFKRRWILTGTPSPNGIMDLFAQIYILDLGRSLGRFITHFRSEFFDQAPFSAYTFTPKQGAFETIVDRISPLVLQLSAEEHLQMPALNFYNLTVKLPDKAMKIYKDMENEFISEMDSGFLVAANAAVAGGKCRQIANGAIYVDLDHNWRAVHDEKLDAMESFIEEMSGKPVLVFYEFRHDYDRIVAKFGPLPHLGSGLSGKQLDRIIDGFNAGNIPILLGHPASMGHGLNLQGACSTALWFGVTWNLEHYDQAIARIYRQGQENAHVDIYHIVAHDTLDETVLETLQTKDKSQQKLLQALSAHRKEHWEG